MIDRGPRTHYGHRLVSVTSIHELLVTHRKEVTLAETSKVRLERMFNDDYDFIWRLLRRLGVGPEKADDACQQVFLVAAERMERIKEGSERSFLFGTALRVAHASFRSKRRWVLEADMDLRLSEAPKVEEDVDRRRAIDLMDRILSEMNMELRTVFILFELEGMTMPAVATLVDVPLGTAASRLRRARETFRDAVAALEKNTRREGNG